MCVVTTQVDPLVNFCRRSQLMRLHMLGRQDRLWNDTNRGRLEKTELILSHCQFVDDKFHTEWPGIKQGLSLERWSTNRRSDGPEPAGLINLYLCN